MLSYFLPVAFIYFSSFLSQHVHCRSSPLPENIPYKFAVLQYLIFQTLMFTICTTCFSVINSALCPRSALVFNMVLRINSSFFALNSTNRLTCICRRDVMCFLWRTNEMNLYILFRKSFVFEGLKSRTHFPTHHIMSRLHIQFQIYFTFYVNVVLPIFISNHTKFLFPLWSVHCRFRDMNRSVLCNTSTWYMWWFIQYAYLYFFSRERI
jgi:hypothetical protein